ncbi:MAG: hypothetical protein J6U54_08495 [Clostridiales bacterium]|nr:hypothetical protein [Clostridiales bacterium]
MKRVKARTEMMRHKLDNLLNKAIGYGMGMDNVSTMDVDDYIAFKEMIDSYKEIMTVVVDWSEALDDQTVKLETLESELKVIQDSIYELTNKVEEVIEKQ